MPSGSARISSFFTASSSSSRGTLSSDDAAMQRAIRLSAAEAKSAALSEDELIQQALEASMADVDSKVTVKRPRSESFTTEEELANSEPKRNKIEVVDPFQTVSIAGDDIAFTPESFNEKSEIINRFDGSLDLLYCKGWIKRPERQQLQDWMLNEMTWHRVSYTKVRSKQKIITPRFTATFGKDDTGASDSEYPVKPKVIPPILGQLQAELQRKSASRFNTIIVNFYQDGSDSISYHADDETFLGPLPTIASLSLGSSRDFFLRRKFGQGSEPSKAQHYTKGVGPAATRPTEKMKLDDGDLIIMKGKTQAEWEHSIPKRANAGGRINLTFRKVVSVKGTNNFQRYNRGLPTDDDTRTYRWDAKKRRMVPGLGGI
ncbi:hypothetical protein CBS101457_002314 [Exobasidium rhododendri]|nr:hypothetical protein CBS101457_002314 [Exobasidium rhododendri]